MFFENAIFNDCKFINCSFFDCYLGGNKFIDCHFENVTFCNNLDVIGNLFERVTGNVERYRANEFNYNIFKDMDFSGFLPIYRFADNSIIWRRNYFINTVISIDKLNEFSKTINKITNDSRNTDNIRFFLSRQPMLFNMITGEGSKYAFKYPYDRKLPVMRDLEGELTNNMYIDLSNLSHEAKLNVIASIFTKYQTGHLLEPWRNEELADISFIKHSTIPSPRPAIIVDNRGYVLNDGVIQDVNFTYNDIKKNGDFYVCDAGKLLSVVYTDKNNILNPNNYSCRSLKLR